MAALAHAGAPYRSMSLLNAAVAVTAVALVLSRAPFPLWGRLSIAFCYFALFEYSVLARQYSLLMLGIFLAASLNAERAKRPLAYAASLALLAQSNLYGVGLAAIWAAPFAWDLIRPHSPPPRSGGGLGWGPLSLAVLTAVFLLDLFELWPAPGSIGAASAAGIGAGGFFLRGPAYLFRAWTAALAPDMRLRGIGASIYAALAAAAVVGALRRHLLERALLGASLGWLAFLYAFSGRVDALRYDGVALLFVLGSLWRASAQRPAAGPWGGRLLFTALLASTPFALKTQWLDWHLPFSGSKAMAAHVAAEVGSDEIAAYPTNSAVALLPYLSGRRFWYAGERRWGTYLVWDAQHSEERITPDELRGRVEAAFAKRPWLLTDRPLPDDAAQGWRLKHAVTEAFGYGPDIYYLYEPVIRENKKRG